ncbi:MmyB family transcriptional regulator [Micromonospora sp. CPCC 206061]|uniref:MmyB family transcriptional regulator n=1 Tax=Micromonospora sp. CPCC 206061 TaxID=3122410 RepID=UPI002FEF2B66
MSRSPSWRCRSSRTSGRNPGSITRLAHPEAGMLRLAYEILDLAADDDQRLIVHLPADPATSAALDRLTSHPHRPLHLVAS